MEVEWDIDWGDGDPDDVVVTATVPVEKRPGWQAEVTLVRRDGWVVIDRMTFTNLGGGESVFDGRVLRAVGLGDLRGEITAALSDKGALAHAVPAVWFDTFAALPRPGRRGRSDIEVAQWCQRYAEACETHPEAPVKYVHDTWHISSQALHAAIQRGEEKGYITKRPGTGKAGGRLTRKAKAVLATHEGSK